MPSHVRYLEGSAPLMSQCSRLRIVAIVNEVGTCDLFFGDVPGRSPIQTIVAPGDSIDAQTAWIDARLAFAESPQLAQAFGGALTQSDVPLRVEPNSRLLAYVRGSLEGSNGENLARSYGSFLWFHVPAAATTVRCAGLCEVVLQDAALPPHPSGVSPVTEALPFHAIAPWLYVVDGRSDRTSGALLRFNERYDRGWFAFASDRLLEHVRVDASVNGWLLNGISGRIVLVQMTAAMQLIAEIVGVCCVLYLLKALMRAPTKRAP